MHEVRDGSRVFKFDGVLLALSTSYRPGSDRWVEFSLYRTVGGQYVLSRVGETTLYHTTECVIAHRNGLHTTPRAALKPGAVACTVCRPEDASGDGIMQELPRYWAQISGTADGVVDSLYRYDESGSRYLTAVARRLLEEASETDQEVDRAYRIETIL